jgi:DNA-binding NarL/FixJ family response regulator
MKLRILLADDHQLVRQGIRGILEREGFEVVGEATNGREAVDLFRELSPDLAILDLAMPLLNGIDAAREILKLAPQTRLILLTMHIGDHQVVGALRIGIRGYVLKTQAAEDLVQAIREVSRGGVYLSPGVSRVVVEAYLSKAELPSDPLSPRERQVLQLVAEGRTTKEVATELGVTVKTAESYRADIMEKLDIHETAGLVRYAIRHGLIQA